MPPRSCWQYLCRWWSVCTRIEGTDFIDRGRPPPFVGLVCGTLQDCTSPTEAGQSSLCSSLDEHRSCRQGVRAIPDRNRHGPAVSDPSGELRTVPTPGYASGLLGLNFLCAQWSQTQDLTPKGGMSHNLISCVDIHDLWSRAVWEGMCSKHPELYKLSPPQSSNLRFDPASAGLGVQVTKQFEGARARARTWTVNSLVKKRLRPRSLALPPARLTCPLTTRADNHTPACAS